MKTTIDIPDATFRRAKAAAALRGQSLRELITEALDQHLERRPTKKTAPREIEKRWKNLARELASGPGQASYVDELLRMRKQK